MLPLSSRGDARFAYDEFFKATLNNAHMRRAYGRIVNRFWGSGHIQPKTSVKALAV
ncbi:MAG: hypothetical protein M3Y72_12280 [Acidobacteriota bacterium]|nr:hypothetical protein [Acidobacteriota bacterium]